MAEIHFHITKERIAKMTLGEQMIIDAAHGGDASEIELSDMAHLLTRFIQIEQISERVIAANGQPEHTEQVSEWVYPDPKVAMRLIKNMDDEQIKTLTTEFVGAIKAYAVPPQRSNESLLPSKSVSADPLG